VRETESGEGTRAHREQKRSGETLSEIAHPTTYLISVTDAGPAPAFTGEPAGVKAPVAESMVKVVTVFDPEFAT